MTLFFLAAAALVIIALAVLLPAALRTQTEDNDQEQQNISIARERMALLQGALDSDDIDQATFNQEKEALERALASDLAASQTTTRQHGGLTAAILVAVFVPLATGALYLQVGTPDAITNPPVSAAEAPTGNLTDPASPGALAELLPGLEQRLEQSPDDVQGWRLLGRSYLMVGEFAKAENALLRARELDPNEPGLIAQLAEAKAMQADGNLAGEPLALLEQGIATAPQNPQILWLLSNARQQQNDHEKALQHLTVLQQVMSHDAEAMQSIKSMIDTSRNALGLPAAAPASSSVTEPSSDEASVTLNVSVSMGPDAMTASDADQTVFIYARAMQGPPMPLAVARTTVGALPTTVQLDNAMAMMPNMALTNFDAVRIGARVSSTGSATPVPGDWFGEVEDVPVSDGTDVTVLINAQRQ